MILEDIVEACRDKNSAVIGGDFNAWATAWGSKRTKIKGRTLLELLYTINVELLNHGRHTFEAGNKPSAIDLTFVQITLVASSRNKMTQ